MPITVKHGVPAADIAAGGFAGGTASGMEFQQQRRDRIQTAQAQIRAQNERIQASLAAGDRRQAAALAEKTMASKEYNDLRRELAEQTDTRMRDLAGDRADDLKDRVEFEYQQRRKNLSFQAQQQMDRGYDAIQKMSDSGLYTPEVIEQARQEMLANWAGLRSAPKREPPPIEEQIAKETYMDPQGRGIYTRDKNGVLQFRPFTQTQEEERTIQGMTQKEWDARAVKVGGVVLAAQLKARDVLKKALEVARKEANEKPASVAAHQQYEDTMRDIQAYAQAMGGGPAPAAFQANEQAEAQLPPEVLARAKELNLEPRKVRDVFDRAMKGSKVAIQALLEWGMLVEEQGMEGVPNGPPAILGPPPPPQVGRNRGVKMFQVEGR